MHFFFRVACAWRGTLWTRPPSKKIRALPTCKNLEDSTTEELLWTLPRRKKNMHACIFCSAASIEVQRFTRPRRTCSGPRHSETKKHGRIYAVSPRLRSCKHVEDLATEDLLWSRPHSKTNNERVFYFYCFSFSGAALEISKQQQHK